MKVPEIGELLPWSELWLLIYDGCGHDFYFMRNQWNYGRERVEAEVRQQLGAAVMTVVGIVGSEAAKFTPETERQARGLIQLVQWLEEPTLVVSGRSPLGGIDWWAVQEAEHVGIPTHEYPPATNRWHDGYKPRNLQIAVASDLVVCITLRELPPSYTGMRFPGCYHCNTPAGHHVKSGGCWTMHQAARMGKRTRLLIVE